MNWTRAGQTDPIFSHAKADQIMAGSSNKAARVNDLKKAKKRAKEEKSTNKS